MWQKRVRVILSYVPPYVPHQEINASADEPLACVLVRSDQEPVVVNLDIPVVEEPEKPCIGSIRSIRIREMINI